MRCSILIAAMLGLGACRGGQAPAADNRTTASAEAPADQSGKGVDRTHRGKPAPAVLFKNPDGGDISLTAFKGSPVLINLWASWCVPCVKELPTLNKLSISHRIDGALGVVAISEDSGPHPSVVAFLAKHRIDDLAPYQDPKMALSFALDAQVLPTSILYDAQGREVWRYVGDLDWTSSQAVKLLGELDAPQPR